MNEQQAREDMVKLGASFFQRGYATGSAGNLSLKLADGTLLTTPTGSCLGELNAERLSKVSLGGEWISGDKPSKEISFHRAIYLNNPECEAVVHLHCLYLTNRPNVFTQLDLFHAQIVDGNLSHLITAFAGRYGHIQIASVPGRHEPAEGEINYAYLFGLLDEINYQGGIGCEYHPRAGTVAGLNWIQPYLS